MNPDKVKTKLDGPYNTLIMTNGKGVTKAFTGSTRPKAVYALRSSKEHDDAGVWVKVFMLYSANTVMIVVSSKYTDSPSNIFTENNLRIISELTEQSWQLPYSTRVDSLTNYTHTWADKDELVDRLIKRGEESGRSDDTPDVIRNRQKIYWEQTAPLLDFYHDKGILKEVDGLGEISEITKRILDDLK